MTQWPLQEDEVPSLLAAETFATDSASFEMSLEPGRSFENKFLCPSGYNLGELFWASMENINAPITKNDLAKERQ